MMAVHRWWWMNDQEEVEGWRSGGGVMIVVVVMAELDGGGGAQEDLDAAALRDNEPLWGRVSSSETNDKAGSGSSRARAGPDHSNGKPGGQRRPARWSRWLDAGVPASFQRQRRALDH